MTKNLEKKKRKPHRRREFVVQKVLKAAREELAHRGLGAFRVERVAKAADVNKTTIYRRWPTKELLVKAALGGEGGGEEAPEAAPAPAGRTREERFQNVSASYLEWLNSDVGRALLRLEQAGKLDAALRKLLGAWIEERRKPLRAFVKKERPRFRPGIDAELFLNAWAHSLALLAARPEPRGKAVRALGAIFLKGALGA